MKGFDEAEDLVYALDEQWYSAIERNVLTLDTDSGLFLENGSSRFVVVDPPPISVFPGFASPAKLICGKLANVDCRHASIRESPVQSAPNITYQNNLDTVKEGAIRVPTEPCALTGNTKTKGSYDTKMSLGLTNSGKAAFKYGGLCTKKSGLMAAQKGHTHLGNRDLLLSESFLTWKEGSIAQVHLPCQEAIKCNTSHLDSLILLPSLGDKQHQAESKVSTSPCSTLHFQSGCECPTGATELSLGDVSPCNNMSSCRSDDQVSRWKASSRARFDITQGCEMLGEALCHAQTRARLAERLAAQALQEKEKLERLLLREAWTTCTYKQRAQALQLENMLLKMSLKIDVEMWMDGKIVHSYECTSNSTKKRVQKCSCEDKLFRRSSTSWQNKGHRSRQPGHGRSPLFTCTLGLAFVLGLSFAGAGLIIGWSMGWILFS